MSAPTTIAATFVGGSHAGKWSYLPAAHVGAEYTSPLWKERYTLLRTVWHSEEDDVMSHQIYTLSPVLFRAKEKRVGAPT